MCIFPDSLMPFACQIAGHGEVKRINNGRVLKPLQPPPRGDREVGFYNEVQNSADDIDKEITEWLPHFYGVEKVESR